MIGAPVGLVGRHSVHHSDPSFRSFWRSSRLPFIYIDSITRFIFVLSILSHGRLFQGYYTFKIIVIL